MALSPPAGFRNLTRFSDSRIEPRQVARYKLWNSGCGATCMENEDGLVLLKRGKAGKGCFMGIDVVQ
jgi:hypothetical protein